MTFRDITAASVKALNGMNFPESVKEQDIRIMWVRLVRTSDDFTEIFAEAHRHTFCEIHICLEGSIAYEIGGNTFIAKAGQGIAIAPAAEHKHSPRGPFVKCVIALSAEREGEFYRSLSALSPSPFPVNDEFGQSLLKLISLSHRQDCFAEKAACGLAFDIAYNLLCAASCPLPRKSDAENTVDPRLLAAKKFICDNSSSLLSCEDVARECGISVKQLGRIFKKYTNQSLAEYIKETKLKTCESLLLDSRYTVKEVGYMMGFENEYYFNSFFKRHYGMPPGAYKKSNSVLNARAGEEKK